MNIVIIPSFFFTEDDPTLGSFFFEQGKALKKQGHTVSFLYVDTYSTKYLSKYKNYKEKGYENIDGIHIYRKKVFTPFKYNSGLFGQRSAFAQGINELFMQYLNNTKVDLIHAHCNVWAGFAAYNLSQKYNIPYIITEHSTLYALHPKSLNSLISRYVEKSFSSAEKVICVSEGLKKSIEKYTSNITIIGNVIDMDNFYPREIPSSNKKNFSFLTVCYMKDRAQLEKKGIDLLIKAFSKIVKSYPDSELRIGGLGEAVEIVRSWSIEYNVEKNIKYLGGLKRAQVADEMNKCDCFVLPSRYETFGVVYVEAMACGKPVIATRTGGPDSFIEKFNGILIENENIEELHSAMEFQINNKHTYSPMEISNYVKSNFSLEAIGPILTSLYEDVIDKKK